MVDPVEIDIQSFVGMSMDKALRDCAELGLQARIVAKDGVAYMVTRDFKPERFNFTVHQGVVTHADRG